MYKLMLGHFHVHRKSNMAVMEAILNCCREFVQTIPLGTKSDIETWGFHINFSLPCICAHLKLEIYNIQIGRRDVTCKMDETPKL